MKSLFFIQNPAHWWTISSSSSLPHRSVCYWFIGWS